MVISLYVFTDINHFFSVLVLYFCYNNLSLPQGSEDNKPLLLFSRSFMVLVFMSIWSVIIKTCVMPSKGSGSFFFLHLLFPCNLLHYFLHCIA